MVPSDRYMGLDHTSADLQYLPSDLQGPFPHSYDGAIRQAQDAVKAAIADGHKLIEVDFPTGGSLVGVSGESEG